jgi:hypothetical protein
VALSRAAPGDVVVLGCASHLNELRDALAGEGEIASVNVSALGTANAGAAMDDVTAEVPEVNAVDA